MTWSNQEDKGRHWGEGKEVEEREREGDRKRERGEGGRERERERESERERDRAAVRLTSNGTSSRHNKLQQISSEHNSQSTTNKSAAICPHTAVLNNIATTPSYQCLKQVLKLPRALAHYLHVSQTNKTRQCLNNHPRLRPIPGGIHMTQRRFATA